jgi:CHAT domain-containing protein/Tfp pilus assembly protein PilF
MIRLFLAFVILWGSAIRTAGQSYLSPLLIKQLSELKRENRFDEALNLLDLQLDSMRYHPDQRPSVEAMLLQADILRMQGNYRQSSLLIDSISETYGSVIEDHVLLSGQLFTVKGTLLLTRGELAKGRSAIENAIKIYTAEFGGEDTLLAPCYNKIGNYYYFHKIYDSALAFYSKALELAYKKKNNQEDIASYIQNIGIIHLEQGDYVKAETCFLESLSIKESIYSQNSFSLGRLYLNLGRFYQGISVLDKSLFYIEKAENIFYTNIISAPIELGGIYWNKGLIYYLLGDFEPAINYLFNAMQIIKLICTDNSQLISSLNADIGNIYKYLGQLNKAIKYYDLAITETDTNLNIKIYRNLANLHLQANDLIKANEYFQKLLKASQNNIKIENPENALTFLYFGNFLLEIGNDSALFYLDKAINIFNKNKGFHDRDVAFSLFSIGDYYYKKNQLYQATRYYQKSLLSFSSTFSDTNILANPPIASMKLDFRIIRALSRKAFFLNELFYKNHDINVLIAATRTYILCLDFIDKVRMTYRAENSQMILLNDINEIYKQALDNCLNAYKYTNDRVWLYEAFKISERGKSIVLLDELKDANAKKIGLIPDDLRKAEKEIKSNLNLFRNNIWEEENQPVPDTKKLSYFRSNQLIYEKKYDSLTDHLEQKYPEYFKLKYDPSVVSVSELQKILEDDEIVIEYSLSKDHIYIFLISEDHFEVKKLPVDSTLTRDIFAMRDNLDFRHVPDYNYKDYMDYQNIAYKLYSVLIQPFAEYLYGKRIIIIPDEELNYLSFEALIEYIIPSDTIEFRHLPYILKKHPVSYAASSTILSLIKKGHMPALNNGVLAIAPSFDIMTRSIFANNKALAQQLKTGMDLPGATWEVENILKLMKGKKLIGEEATESKFKNLASSYDILHFATHTRIDDENPLSSMLSFYPYSNSGEDGVLHTYEIYNLELNGELAVLSACSTGNGKLQKGEGVISLARAFTYAGMPSVMMTLWDVEDVSTGNIIPSFYHLLGSGFDKDIALQMAKLTYLEKTKPEIETHPAFWSGFVLYGNNRGFRQGYDEIYVFSLFILGSLIIFISFVLLRRYINFRKKYRRIDIDLPIEFHSEDRF